MHGFCEPFDLGRRLHSTDEQSDASACSEYGLTGQCLAIAYDVYLGLHQMLHSTLKNTEAKDDERDCERKGLILHGVHCAMCHALLAARESA